MAFADEPMVLTSWRIGTTSLEMSHLLGPADLLQATANALAVPGKLRGKLESLLPARHSPLVISISQSEAILSLGSVCARHFDATWAEAFVSFFPLLETITFKGVGSQQALVKTWIHRYMQILTQLLTTQPQSRHRTEEVIRRYLTAEFEGLYTTLVAIAKRKPTVENAYQRVRVLHELSKQRCLGKKDAELLLTQITQLYLKVKPLSSRLTSVHLTVIRLLENILWSGESLLESHNSDISECFEVTLSLIKKFTKGKHHSEKLVRASVRTVFCILSCSGVEDIGLHYIRSPGKTGNRALRSLSHNSGLEFFIDYFVSQQFTPDKYVDLGRKLLKEVIPYVARYLQFYPERKAEFLTFLHSLHVDLVTKWGIGTDKIEELLANATTTIIMNELSATHDFNNSLALPYFHEQALGSLDLVPYTITSILVEIVSRNDDQTIETQIVNSVLSRLEAVDDKAVYIEFVQSLLKVVKFEDTFRSLLQLLLREFRKDQVMAAVADQEIEELMPRFPMVSFSLMLNFIVDVLLEQVKTIASDGMKNYRASDYLSGGINNAIVFMVQSKVNMSYLDPRLLARFRLFWELLEFFIINFRGNVIGLTYIKQLSEITPLLLDSKSTNSALNLNTCAVFSSESLQTAFTPRARERLQTQLKNSSIGYLEFEEILFCLSVGTIISNKSRPLQACLEYLEDENVMRARGLIDVLGKLIVISVENYMNSLGSKARNEAGEAAVVADLTLLLQRACSKVASVRFVSQELLSMYITRYQPSRLTSISNMSLKTCFSYQFPYLLGNLHVVQVALDLLGCLNMDLTVAYDSLVHTLVLPHSKEAISFPANRSEKESIMEFLRVSLSEMIGKALSINTTEVMSSFAQYTYTSNELLKSAREREESQSVSTITNFGISFFNQVLYSLKLTLDTSTVDLRMAYFDPISFHNWFQSLLSKSQPTSLGAIPSPSLRTGLAALLPNENQMTMMNINYFTTISSTF